MPTTNQQSVSATEQKILQALAVIAAEGGLTPAEFIKVLQTDVRKSANPQRALNNFHRFISAGFSTSLLRDFNEHTVLRKIALEIFSQSQFLADVLVRNPELFSWLTSTNVLKIVKSPNDYSIEASQAVAPFNRVDKKIDALKRFQRRELLRIGAKEILHEADVATTSRELSALADAVVETVVQLGYRQLCESAQTKIENTLAVIGLGKLGGEELNFSSDIDLMFVYEQDAELSAPFERISTLHEFYNRLAEFVVRRLSEHTAEGHLYRVDMRLRPEGHSGPLAISRQGYFNYYETRGEQWERQMLIKARVIAGDKVTGEGWLKDIQPFVFPKTFLQSPLEEIAIIKKKIEANLVGDTNIKLGSGGIRDIEFTVQALQLLNAGSQSQLKNRNTLAAVQSLTEASHFHQKEGRVLIEAYMFLRLVEDHLQLLHGLQTHSLPDSAEEKKVLAKQLGFESTRQFEKELHRHRLNVQKIFRSVFGALGKLEDKEKRGALTSSRQILGLLKKLGCLDLKQAIENVSLIQKELPELQDFGKVKLLFRSIKKAGAPDWCLKNLVLLAASQPIKRTLQQAMDNDEMVELLVLICSRSSKLTALLAQEPLLFESLVGRSEEMFDAQRGWVFFRDGDLLRYRVYNEFKIALQVVLRKISIKQATLSLSDLADEIIQHNIEEVVGTLDDRSSNFKFTLIALGKLGGREITIGSDLDLVFVYRKEHEGEAEKNAVKFIQAMLERFKQESGLVYEVDLRLRPEGKSAPLATGFEYYKQYLESRASLWERQSLVKARVVAGDEKFGEEVLNHLKKWCYHAPLLSQWTKEVESMRQQMQQERTGGPRNADLKVGNGGLVDLEFAVQILQLRYGKEIEQLADTNSFQVIEATKKNTLLTKSDTKILNNNLQMLRRLETIIRLNSDQSHFILPQDKIHLNAISAAMGEKSSAKFLASIRRVRKENRSLFKKILLSLK